MPTRFDIAYAIHREIFVKFFDLTQEAGQRSQRRIMLIRQSYRI